MNWIDILSRWKGKVILTALAGAYITLWVGGLRLFLGVLYYFFGHRQMRRRP